METKATLNLSLPCISYSVRVVQGSFPVKWSTITFVFFFKSGISGSQINCLHSSPTLGKPYNETICTSLSFPSPLPRSSRPWNLGSIWLTCFYRTAHIEICFPFISFPIKAAAQLIPLASSELPFRIPDLLQHIHIPETRCLFMLSTFFI